MAKTNAKQRLRARRRRERLRSTFLWVAAGIAVIAVLAALVWSSIRPPGGEAVPVMASVQHVAEGQDPGPFNTDPPTSGPHYASPLKAGFYDEPMVADLGPYPEDTCCTTSSTATSSSGITASFSRRQNAVNSKSSSRR